jgi:hypothetical protein
MALKNDSKLNFRILRHPGAFSRGYEEKRTKVYVEQIWEFDIEDLILTQVNRG